MNIYPNKTCYENLLRDENNYILYILRTATSAGTVTRTYIIIQFVFVVILSIMHDNDMNLSVCGGIMVTKTVIFRSIYTKFICNKESNLVYVCLDTIAIALLILFISDNAIERTYVQ